MLLKKETGSGFAVTEEAPPMPNTSAAEFSGRFYKNRKALPAEALHCNTSYLTAVANDYSYDVIYSRLIDGITTEGDVLVGLSTSR
jgi:D-sedoheptulose 7-phosphate isomerase